MRQGGLLGGVPGALRDLVGYELEGDQVWGDWDVDCLGGFERGRGQPYCRAGQL